jgi:hypothetical protein
MTKEDFAAKMARLEGLITHVEATCPPEPLELVRELVSTLLDVHRSGLTELIAGLGGASTGAPLPRAVVDRPTVASLLLMHDLHPDAPADRVERAVREANELASGAAHAELLSFDGAGAVVRIQGKPAGAELLGKVLDRVVTERAPDVALRIEAGAPQAKGNLVPISRLRERRGGAS